jgi:hypothetical protein
VTFDYELILIGTEPGENELGDPILVPVRRPVLCDVLSVTRSEHYQAAAHGLKPEMVFVVNRYEYQGEKEVEFEEREYRVMRTYLPRRSKSIGDFETIELVCEGVVHGAGA